MRIADPRLRAHALPWPRALVSKAVGVAACAAPGSFVAGADLEE